MRDDNSRVVGDEEEEAQMSQFSQDFFIFFFVQV
jgi:hypothetical protein